MANKNFLDEEMLDDEDLDNVAGGNHIQASVDCHRLFQAGLCNNNYGEFQISADPNKVAEIKAAWAKINVDFEYREHGSNKYYMNGQEISCEEARAQIGMFKVDRMVKNFIRGGFSS